MTTPAAPGTRARNSAAIMPHAQPIYQRRPCALALLAAALSLAAFPHCDAVTPLSGWTQGIATNYGGPADGMSPYSPSFGTENVSPLLVVPASAA